MAMSAKPRVNGSMLPKHMDRCVCFVGRNPGASFRAGAMSTSLEASDKQLVNIHLQQPLSEPFSQYVEVVGRVQRDCSIAAHKIVSVGADFDFERYNKVIQLCSRYPELFCPQSLETFT